MNIIKIVEFFIGCVSCIKTLYDLILFIKEFKKNYLLPAKITSNKFKRNISVFFHGYTPFAGQKVRFLKAVTERREQEKTICNAIFAASQFN